MTLVCPNFCPKLGQKSDPLLLKQVLMRKTAALLALLLTAPVQGIAAERAPYPKGKGSGWIHIRSECVRGGTYCPDPMKLLGNTFENNYRQSWWGRGAGKRGKVTFVQITETYVGMPDYVPLDVDTYALNCEMWEAKVLDREGSKYETIKPTSVLDAASLLVCD